MPKTGNSSTLICFSSTLIASALLWGAIWISLQTVHSESIDHAAAEGRNLARIISENEASSIQSIDLLVKVFCNAWIRDPAVFSETIEQHRELLKKSSILQIAVIGADGRVAFSNIPGWTPVDLSDRQHFKIHKERGTDEMFISSPVLGRVSLQWTIQFTRPIFDKNKKFAGVLVASIPPPALERNYRNFDLGEGAVVTLVRFDGQVMGRSNEFDKSVVVSLANTYGLRPEDPATGEYRRASRIDGVERLFLYEKVGSYPLSVYVGQRLETILAPYHRLRITYLIAGALATVLMMVVSLLIVSRFRRDEEAQKNRMRLEAALRQSEEKFRLIAETIDDVVWSVDLFSGGSAYINPSYERIWGCKAGEAPWVIHPLAEFVCPEDCERILADFDLNKIKEPFEHEYRILHSDGSLRWIWGRGFPVRSENGEISRCVGVAQDITERKRAEEEIRQFNQVLEQRVVERTAQLEQTQAQLLQSEKMAAIGQLAAGVAHEINNPIGFVTSNLGTLKTYTEDMLHIIDTYETGLPLLAANNALQYRVKEAYDRVDLAYLREDIGNLIAETIDGTSRVSRIVRDLRDFSRIDSADWQYADLHAGLESTLNVVWNEIKFKADVIREFGTIPLVECRLSQINQVFMNILVNAAHAIHERGTITLRSGWETDQVWISISDTGQGIPPELLNRIFDPFFTTKQVGNGTGLGLSVSFGIVCKHGGHIDVQSQLGEGTTFTIWLPVKHQDNADQVIN